MQRSVEIIQMLCILRAPVKKIEFSEFLTGQPAMHRAAGANEKKSREK